MSAPDLQLATLRAGYAAGTLTPADVVAAVDARIRTESPGGDGLWLDREPLDAVLEQLADADPAGPLYGVPFALKDNIDVAGRLTTAACPAFARTAADDATLVARLRAAGALYLGKLNLDQFATGLVGTRSPYGVPRNPFDATLVPGGSSSGSGVAVAEGLVTFAIGTDTAGSGRVPAALTNTVGLKPSRGLVSTAGVVPACRSLDCPSVHALTVDDAWQVLRVIAGPDPADPWTRDLPHPLPPTPTPGDQGLRGDQGLGGDQGLRGSRRLGVPPAALVAQVSTPEVAAAFERTRNRLAATGATLVEVDMSPFFEAGDLLYEGPWVAERWTGLATFVEAHPEDLLPVTRAILTSGTRFSAVEAFAGIHRLQELRARAGQVLAGVDALVLPTITAHPTLEAVAADPVRLNAAMGRWTTFGNLLDLAAVAVPQELGAPGHAGPARPFGAMVVAAAGRDARLATIASALHRAAVIDAGLTAGATGHPVPPAPTDVPSPALPPAPTPAADDDPDTATTLLVVAGAHMTGLPLHAQLTGLGGRFRESARTAPLYRMIALDGEVPRPGLIRQPDGGGACLEVEVHELPQRGLGELMVTIKPPLAIGTVVLDDGRELPGFVCEGHAAVTSPDITASGGWRAHLRAIVT